MSINTKMTAIADEVRKISGVENKLGIDDMTLKIEEANAQIEVQSDLISQISTLVEQKSISQGGIEPSDVTATESEIMSDYNAPLQINNSSLEDIINKLNDMPNPGPDITDATATANDILEGKTAYTASGKTNGAIPINILGDITVNGSKITIPKGYYASNYTQSVDLASQASPVISINSSGLITASATQVEGYVLSGSKSSTKQLSVQGTSTITPGTTNKTAVTSGKYTTGTITVKGDSNLVSENIKDGVSIFGVTGTYEGSGGSSTGDTSNEDGIIDKTISTYANNRVSKIGEYAFCFCSSLKSVDFPECTSIGSSAFMSCQALTTISFPKCTTIGNSAFMACKSLITASFPECTTIGNSAFMSCQALTTISFPKCTSIGSSAFMSCKSLTTVSFPECTLIENRTFYFCSSLKSVNFPKCTSIDGYAFQSCPSLTTINIPKCTAIGAYAFAICTSLSTVSFSECTTIGNGAFETCRSLNSVNIPKCTSIGSSAFMSCTSLSTVSFPECTIIGSRAFQLCSSLNSVNIPKCTSIGSSAFQACTSLTTVSFPECTTIGNSAFYSCSSLATIYLMGSSLCKISNSIVFSYTKITNSTGSIYVPTSLVTSYKNATGWTYFSNRIYGK